MIPAVLSAHMHANTLGERVDYAEDKEIDDLRAWLAAEKAFYVALGVSVPLLDPTVINDPIRMRGIARELRSGRLGLVSIMQ